MWNSQTYFITSFHGFRSKYKNFVKMSAKSGKKKSNVRVNDGSACCNLTIAGTSRLFFLVSDIIICVIHDCLDFNS